MGCPEFSLHSASVQIWIPAFSRLSALDVDFNLWRKRCHSSAGRSPAVAVTVRLHSTAGYRFRLYLQGDSNHYRRPRFTWAPARYLQCFIQCMYQRTLGNIWRACTVFCNKHFEDCLLSSLCPTLLSPTCELWSGCPAQRPRWVLVCDCRCPFGNETSCPPGETVLSWGCVCLVACPAAASPSIAGQSLDVLFFCFPHSHLWHSSAFHLCWVSWWLEHGSSCFEGQPFVGEAQVGDAFVDSTVRTQVHCMESALSSCPQ